jgi:uncharacterized protein (DUF427 family)
MRRPPRIEPGPGQESVWDYPRPPRVEATTSRVEVELGGVVIASSVRALRVLETSQPPAFYVPPDDVAREHLVASAGQTFCEWKGLARYVSVVVGDRRVDDAGWFYEQPARGFEAITGHIAFYAQKMDMCRVDGEVVDPNEGSFYGGWITSKVVGPFKGGSGSMGW